VINQKNWREWHTGYKEGRRKIQAWRKENILFWNDKWRECMTVFCLKKNLMKNEMKISGKRNSSVISTKKKEGIYNSILPDSILKKRRRKMEEKTDMFEEGILVSRASDVLQYNILIYGFNNHNIILIYSYLKYLSTVYRRKRTLYSILIWNTSDTSKWNINGMTIEIPVYLTICTTHTRRKISDRKEI